MTNKKWGQIIRCLLVVIFGCTGVSKILDYKQFVSQVKESPYLLPIAGLAWMVPGVELLTVFLLLKRHWQLIGLYTSSLLMLLFTIYMTAISNFTYYIPCSCGGWLERLPADVHIFLNCLLTVIAFTGVYLEKKIQARGEYKLNKSI